MVKQFCIIYYDTIDDFVSIILKTALNRKLEKKNRIFLNNSYYILIVALSLGPKLLLEHEPLITALESSACSLFKLC